MRKEIEIRLKNVIQKYLEGVFSYLEFTQKSPIVTNSKNNKITHLGFRAITHIFLANYSYTSDANISLLSMQKGYLYYLEYLEQVEENNMNENLNHTNALVFVYSKSIIEYSNDNREFQENNKIVLEKIQFVSKLIEATFWWENKLIDQNQLESLLLKNLSIILIQMQDTLLVSHILFGQKRKMTHDEYVEFLQCTQKIFRENIKNSVTSLSEWEKNIAIKTKDIGESADEMSVKKWCKSII